MRTPSMVTSALRKNSNFVSAQKIFFFLICTWHGNQGFSFIADAHVHCCRRKNKIHAEFSCLSHSPFSFYLKVIRFLKLCPTCINSTEEANFMDIPELRLKSNKISSNCLILSNQLYSLSYPVKFEQLFRLLVIIENYHGLCPKTFLDAF